MTEAEWLACQDPDPLLRWLQKSRRHRPTPRKMGLFACACARRLGDLAGDKVTAWGLDLAERMAEGIASKEEHRSFVRASLAGPGGKFIHVAVWAVRILDTGQNWSSAEGAARSVAGYAAQGLGPDEPAEQCRLLREVVGNPYRPVAVGSAWRAPAVLALAQAAYDERLLPSGHLDEQQLAVLADALTDAGCTDAALLDHLRGPGPHVRGCFAVDLLLSKE